MGAMFSGLWFNRTPPGRSCALSVSCRQLRALIIQESHLELLLAHTACSFGSMFISHRANGKATPVHCEIHISFILEQSMCYCILSVLLLLLCDFIYVYTFYQVIDKGTSQTCVFAV